MLHLNELRLRNYALFAEQDFTFEPGLTVIGGRNRVGKSLLFSALRPLLFNLPSGEHLPKGSHVELDMQQTHSTGKTSRMTIVADSPKNKPDWKLIANGEDKRTHKKRSVRDLIDRRINLTEDLFDSNCHLTISPRSLPLFMGTPATKLDWLASVFNLSSTYSQMEEMVGEQLKQLTKDEIRLNVLTSSLMQLPEQVDETKLEKLQGIQAKLKKKIGVLSNNLKLQQEYASLKSLEKALRKRKTTVKTLDALNEEIEMLQQQQKKLANQKRDREDYQDELRAYKKATALREQILQQLPERLRPTSRNHAIKLLTDLREQRRRAENELVHQDTHEAELRSWKKAYKQIKDTPKPELNEEEAQYLVNEKAEQASMARGILNNLRKTSKVHKLCPQCGSGLNKKHVHSLHEQYEQSLKKANRQLKKAEQAVEYYALRDKLANTPVENVDWKSVEKKLRNANKYAPLLQQLIDTTEVVRPEKPSKLIDGNSKEITDRLQDLLNDQHIFEAHGKERFPPLHEIELRIEELTDELKDVPNESMEQLSDRAMEVGETIHTMKLQMQAYKMARRHNVQMEEEITALKKRCRVIRPLRALKDAFGRSGIMLNTINDAIEHLVQEINDLVPMLLDEKFRVEIVTGPRKLNVVIERNGKSEGIRTLSTSEQRCWTLLFATAMMRILPNSMLVDTIILDELESNMDAISRKRYATEFIPFLQTIVPKVVVVTPQISGELILQPDRAFRVEKKNNVSSLRQIA